LGILNYLGSRRN